MQAVSDKYRLIVFDYSDTLVNEETGAVLISGEIITCLKRKGLRLAVFTGSAEREIRRVLEDEYSGVFDVVVTRESVKRTKPDPEGLILIIKEVCMNKDEVLFVGDSKNDELAASAAGIDFLHITDM